MNIDRTLRETWRALLILGLLALPGWSYGAATHAWLAERAIAPLVAADPGLGFLATDPAARACFQYGAMFPDVRSVASKAASLENLRQQLEATPFVQQVLFATHDARDAYSSFNTHGADFLLSLVERAQLGSDPYRLAFALGNLAHALQDKHAQLFYVPWRTQGCGCGDLGVEPAEDPAAAAGWYEGYENELFIEGFADQLRAQTVLEFVRDAPWRLAGSPAASYQRAEDLWLFYGQAVEAFVLAHGGQPPSQAGVRNGARLFEVALGMYPYVAGKELLGDAMRRLVARHILLEPWAQALVGIAGLLTQALTASQDIFALIGPLIPTPLLGSVS